MNNKIHIIYDDNCALCRASVDALKRADKAHLLTFAPFQPSTEGETDDIKEVIAIKGEKLLTGADAIQAALESLPRPWRILAVIMNLMPRWMTRFVYKQIANNRQAISKMWQKKH